jgi:hypothetical protein
MLSIHLHLGLRSGLFPFGLPTVTYMRSPSPFALHWVICLVGSEFSKEMTMKNTVSWDVTSCSPVENTWHLGEMYRLQLQGKSKHTINCKKESLLIVGYFLDLLEVHRPFRKTHCLSILGWSVNKVNKRQGAQCRAASCWVLSWITVQPRR